MPGRNANPGSYRHGYQGSEKDDEITGTPGTHISTFFRENDTRLGRWWGVDPKTGLSPWESPYASMGGNPIWYNDPLGDIFDVADDDNSKSDVKSLAMDGNKDFIKFNEKSKGVSNVSLDFGDKTKEEITEILDNDNGLKLINDLITATKPEDGSEVSFFYSNSNKGTFISPSSGEKKESSHYTRADGVLGGFVDNLSTKMYSELKSKRTTGLPPNGYDGSVRISDGFFALFDKKSDSYLRIERSSIVFHELAENYFRTVMCLPYNNEGSTIGAHKMAIDLEGTSQGRTPSNDESMPVIFIPF